MEILSGVGCLLGTICGHYFFRKSLSYCVSNLLAWVTLQILFLFHNRFKFNICSFQILLTIVFMCHITCLNRELFSHWLCHQILSKQLSGQVGWSFFVPWRYCVVNLLIWTCYPCWFGGSNFLIHSEHVIFAIYRFSNRWLETGLSV